MYDLQYVKKRRRKKIAAFVSLFAGIGITSLVIVSFLGRTTGTFSVSIRNSSVRLSLSQKEVCSDKDLTSYLLCDQILKFREFSFTRFNGEIEALDDENVTYENDEKASTYTAGKRDAFNYFKYTFYVRNTGSSIAQYNLSLKLTDIQASQDDTKRTLDDTLRVAIFENDPKVQDSHNYEVYAQESKVENYDINKKPTHREFVVKPPEYNDYGGNYETEEYKLCKKFSDARYSVKDFASGEMRRYTIVIWLDGEDPDARNDDEPPVGASVKLGIDIAAYENSDN